MGKWTMHCALFDVIIQLCHVIQVWWIPPIVRSKHLASLLFVIYFFPVLFSIVKRPVQQKRYFVLLPQKRWNVFKMTKIWSMNRPNEWIQFRCLCDLKCTIPIIWSGFIAAKTIWTVGPLPISYQKKCCSYVNEAKEIIILHFLSENVCFGRF